MSRFQLEIPLEYFIYLTRRNLWKWANSLRAQMFFSCCNVISGTQTIGIFDWGYVKKSMLRHLWQKDKHNYSCLSEIWWALGNPSKRSVMLRPTRAILVSLSFSSFAGEMVRLFIYCRHQKSSWVGGFSIKGEQRDVGLWCGICVCLVTWDCSTCQCAHQLGKMSPGQTSEGHYPSVSISIFLSLAVFVMEYWHSAYCTVWTSVLF